MSLDRFFVTRSFCNYRYVETNGKDRYGMPEHACMGQVLTAAKAEILVRELETGNWDDNPYIEVQMWDRPGN